MSRSNTAENATRLTSSTMTARTMVWDVVLAFSVRKRNIRCPAFFDLAGMTAITTHKSANPARISRVFSSERVESSTAMARMGPSSPQVP